MNDWDLFKMYSTDFSSGSIPKKGPLRRDVLYKTVLRKMKAFYLTLLQGKDEQIFIKRKWDNVDLYQKCGEVASIVLEWVNQNSSHFHQPGNLKIKTTNMEFPQK